MKDLRTSGAAPTELRHSRNDPRGEAEVSHARPGMIGRDLTSGWHAAADGGAQYCPPRVRGPRSAPQHVVRSE